MEYLALIHADQSVWETMTDAERDAAYEQYGEFADAARAAGVLVGGEELASTASATTVRVRDDAAARHRRAVRRGEGGARRLLHPRLRVVRRRARLGRADSRGPSWRRRGSPRPRRPGGLT